MKGILTGEARESFLNWLKCDFKFNDDFDKLLPIFQIALLTEWFDSLNQNISIVTEKVSTGIDWDCHVNDEWVGASFKNRKECALHGLYFLIQKYNNKL